MQVGDDCVDDFDPCNFICGELKSPTIARHKAEYPKHQMLSANLCISCTAMERISTTSYYFGSCYSIIHPCG